MIYLVIPTYKRVKKLKRCIDSIYKSSFKDWRIVVVADNNDAESAVFAYSLQDERIDVLVQPEHKFVIGAWNRFAKEYQDREWDGFVGLCDDVELEPDALAILVQQHKEHFPDTDGVLGMKQVCPGHSNYTFKWFGQTLMGRKFVERYQPVDYQICCPSYFHFFQDEEMFRYASSLGKFIICEKAVLKHYHPAFIKSEIDETHKIIRESGISPKAHDIRVWEDRNSRLLTWGKSWEL